MASVEKLTTSKCCGILSQRKLGEQSRRSNQHQEDLHKLIGADEASTIVIYVECSKFSSKTLVICIFHSIQELFTHTQLYYIKYARNSWHSKSDACRA